MPEDSSAEHYQKKKQKDDKERCEKNIEIFLKKEKKKMTIVL